MKATFLYPDSQISPHPSLEAWAMSVCSAKVKTPKGFGLFNINNIPESDILLLESLYCLPFAKRYKKKNGCKIVQMIVDTSFWEKKLSFARRLFYKKYLKYVDAFITLSDRSKEDIIKFMKIENMDEKPIDVIRPFLANKYDIKRKIFNKNILFIGNDVEEKGYKKLIDAMILLPDFELYLVGNCYKKLPKHLPKNVHVEGRVPDLKKYFNICTYYAHPADFEPFGVAPLEAMYAEQIPILTKEVGLTEVFNTILEKILLENNNPRTIARKIHQIDTMDLKYKKVLVKESKKLAQQFTKDKNLSMFKKEFLKILELI